MKKNKGYYSWIHTMKNAAMESHFKGQQMLNEEKAKKGTFDASKFQASMPKASVEHGKPDIDPNVIRAAAQVLAKEPTTSHSISLAGGDAGEYANIRRMKHAEKLAQIAQSRGPVDAAPEGDANVVADDAEDGVMADPPLTRLPSYPVAAEARDEVAREIEAEEWEADEEARLSTIPMGTTNWKTVKESVNDKISKFLRN